MKKIVWGIFSATLVLCVGLVVGSSKAHAASLTVSGGCTLDAVITSVNGGANSGGCTASGTYGTNDTITLPAGTITLAADITTLTRSATVVGAGMGQTTIDGVSSYFGMTCAASSPPTTIAVTLRGFTLTRMALGALGAIQACNLAVSEVEVTQSTAGTLGLIVFSDDLSGTFTNLTVNSSMSDIYIHDNATVLNNILVTVYSTSPSNNTNNVTINRATFSQNPNAVAIGATSYGYVNNTANLIITNTTIDGSSQPGLGIVAGTVGQYGGTATTNVQVRNTSIVNFTSPSSPYPAAGIYIGAGAQAGNTANVTLQMQNTLLAGNTINGSPLNCLVQNQGQGGSETSTFTSQGHNITDDATCGTAQPSDKYSLSTNSIVSTLGPLQNNGGLVPTRALLPGSPAIDAGTAIGGITTDARGIARPQGAGYDIGPFELVQASPSTSPTPGPADPGSTANLAETGLNWVTMGIGVLGLFVLGAYMVYLGRRA